MIWKMSLRLKLKEWKRKDEKASIISSQTNSACPQGPGQWSTQPSGDEDVLGLQKTAKTQKRPSQKFSISLRHQQFHKHRFFSPFPPLTFSTLVKFCLGLWSFSLCLCLMLRRASDCTRVENGSTLSRLRWMACQVGSPRLLRAACYPGLISSPLPRVAPRVIDFCHRSRLSLAQPLLFDLSPKKYKRSCLLHLIRPVTGLRCGWGAFVSAKKGWRGRAVVSDKTAAHFFGSLMAIVSIL